MGLSLSCDCNSHFIKVGLGKCQEHGYKMLGQSQHYIWYFIVTGEKCQCANEQYEK
jgi:hypothetical protein